MAPFRHVDMGNVCKLHRVVTLCCFCVCVAAIVKLSASDADDTSESASSGVAAEQPLFFDQLYAEGVKAYNDQLWYKCAYNVDKSIKEYNSFKTTLTDCRLKCKKGEEDAYLDKMPSDLGEFSLFARFLKHADCFRRCKSDAYVVYERRPGLRLTKSVELTFESRKPYQYLQFCWYKLDRVKEAASASYTFYLVNPQDEDVKKNIAFYRDKAKVPERDFIDLELKPYKEHYIRAMLAYGEQDWTNVVDHLEKSIADFLLEEERCRADCEDNMELGEPSHFTGIIADHILKVLECQIGCDGNLSVVYTYPLENFLAEQFHYLQYSYYQLEKVQEAVDATATFLLFMPEDDVVLENKNVFKRKYKFDDDQFVPRSDGKKYVERRQKLKALLDFLRENMMPDVPDTIFITNQDTYGEEVKHERSTQPTTDHQLWMERYERLGLHVIAKEDDLKRQYRFAADGLLKQEQCEEILTLMNDIEVDKKGVKIFTLEHGRETVVAEDESYEASLRLFMRATEVMRHYTQRYYNFSDSLYFRNTTMVCWQELEKPEVENGCVPQEFGTCDPEITLKDSTLVEKQFVTVTYLNTLDDADVYFLGENASVDASLGVKTGRTIGFQFGDRHGLHIPSAPRCAIVITYTTYRSPEEEDYISTIQMLQQVDQIRMNRNVKSQEEVMKEFDEGGVKIVRNSSMLRGGERFVADGLASDAECATLRNMVMELGKMGDGYDGKQSPHTKNELFSGLSLRQLTQDLEKLMYMGLVNTLALQSFLDLSEKGRLLVEKYFNLSSHLYFDFTHLVCRSAVDDSKARDDLSHPVHADNCVLQPNGRCLREYPAFTQRDYSALLYLNDDFDGGEFFFAHWNTTEQVSLHPKCGRLVGFNATEFHGVKAVRSGTRCALALWFTLNPHFKEIAHIHARKILRSVLAERAAKEKEAHKPSGNVNEGDGAEDKLSENGADLGPNNNIKNNENEWQATYQERQDGDKAVRDQVKVDSSQKEDLISSEGDNRNSVKIPANPDTARTGIGGGDGDDDDNNNYGFSEENTGYVSDSDQKLRNKVDDHFNKDVIRVDHNTKSDDDLIEGDYSDKEEL